MLADAGFGSVTIHPFDARIGGLDVEQTLKLALRVGQLGEALRENPKIVHNVTDAVRDVLSRYVTPNGVLMPAAQKRLSVKSAVGVMRTIEKQKIHAMHRQQFMPLADSHLRRGGPR